MLLAVHVLVQRRTPSNVRAPMDWTGWFALMSREYFPRCSWGVTSIQNFTDFNARRKQDYHLVFSVRHEVPHDASSFVPLCSGYTAEEVFRLRSADNWRPQKVIKEVSFTHYSQQTTYVKLIKNSLSSLGNF